VRKKWKIVSLILLTVLAAVAPPVRSQQAKPPVAGSSLPSVNEILEKSVRATGGRESWLKLTSLHLKADVTMNPPNMTGKLEVYSKAPDKEADCVRFPQGFFFCRLYDGKSGWQDDSQNGLKPLEGEPLEDIRREADFYSELNRATNYSEMKVTREDDFDGLRVYVIQGVRKDGKKQELYFAKDTGLQVGTKDTGASESETKSSYFEDYQQIAGPGIKIPTKMRVVSSAMTIRLIVQEIMPNVEISDTVFAKPTKSARDAPGVGHEDHPDNGKVVDGIYTNDFFGFRYTIPSGWTVHGEETQKAIMETGKDLIAGDDAGKKSLLDAGAKGTTQLLTAFEYPLGTPGKENRGIQLAATKVSFAPGIKTGKDYLALVSQYLRQSAVQTEEVGEPVEHQIAGMDFYCQRRNLTISNVLVNESTCAAIVRGYALYFVFSAKGNEKLEESESTLNTLTRTTSSAKP
jgi:hypothetical protein